MKTLLLTFIGACLGMLVGQFIGDLLIQLAGCVKLWKARRAYKSPTRRQYEEFTPGHHRYVKDEAAFLGECKICGRPGSHPIHLHPHKVWSATDLADDVPPIPGTVAAVLRAAMTVDFNVKMYTLDDRWPFTLFVEPSDGIDGLALLKAIEPQRCMGVLVRLVGRETPELPWVDYTKEEL